MRFLVALLLLIGCGCSDSAAHDPVATSLASSLALSGRVVDAADLLDEKAEQALTRRSTELEAATTDQLVIVTLPSLDGLTIEQTASQLANRWGVGRKDVDNGVLVVVAPNEKKVRIATGYGLEGLLTDERAVDIVELMLPIFRNGDTTGAILLGTEKIDGLLRSDLRRPQYRARPTKQAA